MATQDKWKMLSERLIKTGRKREYTLTELQDEFIAFVAYYADHPSTFARRAKQKQKGKDKHTADFEIYGDRVDRVAPMTELSFCAWLGKARSWFPQTIADLRDRVKRGVADEEDANYLDLMLRIKTFLQSQLLEGAILGEYTPNLIASLLDLRSNFDLTSNGQTTGAPVINIVEDTQSHEHGQEND